MPKQILEYNKGKIKMKEDTYVARMFIYQTDCMGNQISNKLEIFVEMHSINNLGEFTTEIAKETFASKDVSWEFGNYNPVIPVYADNGKNFGAKVMR